MANPDPCICRSQMLAYKHVLKRVNMSLASNMGAEDTLSAITGV